MAGEWEELTTFRPGPNELRWPWHMVLATFSGRSFIRIEAKGTWNLLPGLDLACGPDGQPLLRLAEAETFLAGCAPGALIGKIGGSSADTAMSLLAPPAAAAAAAVPTPTATPTTKTGETPVAAGEVAGGAAAEPPSLGVVFIVGSVCVVPVGPATQGPIFLGFNIRSRPTNFQDVEVKISALPQS